MSGADPAGPGGSGRSGWDAWAADEAAVRAALSGLGDFFAAATHRPGSPVRLPWRSMAELTGDPPVLRERVAAVRAALAAAGGRGPEEVESRVAASVTHLGVVARVLSPYLALAVVAGRVPDHRLRLADLRWQPVLGGPYPLSLPAGPGGGARERAAGAAGAAGTDAPAAFGPTEPTRAPTDTSADALAGALGAALLDGPVRELAAPFAAWGVSPHILRGNAASAVNGAVTMAVAARPELGPRARALAASLLDGPPLRGAAGTGPDGSFRRRSCCLIYRAAPGHAGALCGDCVLRRDVR